MVGLLLEKPLRALYAGVVVYINVAILMWHSHRGEIQALAPFASNC